MNVDKLDCYSCGRIYIAMLRSGRVARIKDIVLRTTYSQKMVRFHLNHLAGAKLVEDLGGRGWALTGSARYSEHGKMPRVEQEDDN